MSTGDSVSFECTARVRDACMCLLVNRAARKLSRLFDDVLAPAGLTNGQFSLLMSLNRPTPPRMGEVAEFLAMDRTTLTANLKPLMRRRLAKVVPDRSDKRGRRVNLTAAGRKALAAAVPLWETAHGDLEQIFDRSATALRADLQRICRYQDL
ncbi:MAG: winged helix-turn-helix transcriptional regulator [Alphaproteobacteria bacterium]|nr:winged helix-turn-helix transcriptional regulator [Alphaproteobacteria bacterium]